MRTILPKLTFFLLRSELFDTSTPPAAEPAPDVPFVPSSRDVILAMLDLAGVSKNDVLYDLGCGDGRIVIMAARHREPARCVGIEIDERRAAVCLLNVKKMKVEERVTIIKGDLFSVDISAASVVTLYLLTSVNLRVRRRLLTELKPGARVVSHDFDMGEWKPDRVSYVGATAHKIFRWTVPANVSGLWRCTVAGERCTLRIDQKYQRVSGTLVSPSGPVPLRDAKLEGARIAFRADVEADGKRVEAEFNACADGDILAGAVEWSEDGRKRRLYWEARRQKHSISPIDDDEGVRVAALLH
jgi:Predicted O-methyltransferase